MKLVYDKNEKAIIDFKKAIDIMKKNLQKENEEKLKIMEEN